MGTLMGGRGFLWQSFEAGTSASFLVWEQVRAQEVWTCLRRSPLGTTASTRQVLHRGTKNSNASRTWVFAFPPAAGQGSGNAPRNLLGTAESDQN